MNNSKIASVFEEMGNILDIKGASFFRVNAYRKGALNILNLGRELRDIYDGDIKTLEDMEGIGDGLAKKIVELLETGKCQELEELKKDFPVGLLDILELRGVGPKKVKLFYKELDITSIEQLKDAAEKGLLRSLEKMGEKSEQEILKAIEEKASFSSSRFLIDAALAEANGVMAHMNKIPGIKRMAYAGSLRRMQETIGDIDILVTVDETAVIIADIMRHFVSYPDVYKVIAEGDTKSSIVLNTGISADLRVVDDSSFGAAMYYFTGNKLHNIKIRDIAKKKGLKVNEYGLFEGEKKIAGENEEDIFMKLGMPYIVPELRQDDGEFEYALSHDKMPDLVELRDIKGDLHCHSVYSDGKNSIEEMAECFLRKGYEYFAITDHSKAVGVTGGMDDNKIRKQWQEIDNLNVKFRDRIKILKGCEVDILRDGSLDFSDEILKELDIVIISAHINGKLDYDAQTKRLIKAIESPYAKILGHPTARIINKRSPIEFDMEKVFKACVANDVWLEINSNPHRLDLAEKHIKLAKSFGAKFVINTDSHNIDQTDFIGFGVGMARRGWLTKDDVVNCFNSGKFDTAK